MAEIWAKISWAPSVCRYSMNFSPTMALKLGSFGSVVVPFWPHQVTKPWVSWPARRTICPIWSAVRAESMFPSASPKMGEKSGAGAPATRALTSSEDEIAAGSMLAPDMSMPERSTLPSLDASKVKALRSFAWSTEKRLPRSTPFLASSWSSSKDLPVKTSVLGSASCCLTMSELAARAMSSSVRPWV